LNAGHIADFHLDGVDAMSAIDIGNIVRYGSHRILLIWLIEINW